MKFYQGATYNLPFYLSFGKGWIIPEDITEIEFYFGDIVKYYSRNEIIYNVENKNYTVRINENDTLQLSHKKKHNLQIRVIFKDGNIKFSTPQEFLVDKTNYSDLKE